MTFRFAGSSRVLIYFAPPYSQSYSFGDNTHISVKGSIVPDLCHNDPPHLSTRCSKLCSPQTTETSKVLSYAGWAQDPFGTMNVQRTRTTISTMRGKT